MRAGARNALRGAARHPRRRVMPRPYVVDTRLHGYDRNTPAAEHAMDTLDP
jgi:hypothetical protein